MKISFDAQPIIDSKKTGIGYAQYWIIKKILEKNIDIQIELDMFTFNNRVEKLHYIEEFKNVQIDECKWFPSMLYKLISSFIPLKRSLFIKNKKEIVHFFNYHVPPGSGGKNICTIHDMAYIDVPETVKLKTRKNLDINLKKSIKRADKIMTISEFSKSRICDVFNVDEKNIFVIPLGVNTNFFKKIDNKEKVVEVKNKYHIQGDYFLYIGTIEPRKNLERLIKAYSIFRESGNNITKLVLAGKKGWYYEEIFEVAQKSKYSDDIIFTDYVEEEDIVPLLNGSEVFVFPSIYEGFGLPPLEAMACGVPVLTSNNTSLGEYFGDCSVTVDPYSIENIALGLGKIINNNELRAGLIEKGYKKVKQLSWDNTVDILVNEYDKLMCE